MMRDWTKLLPASYNGIAFEIDSEEMSAGRRQALHMVAGEMPVVIEEVGPGARGFSVTAYLLGDLADVRSHALVAALMAPGPGLLVLPIDGPVMVHVVEDGIRRARSKDRNGYVAMDLGFIVADAGAPAALGLGDIRFAFAAALTGASLALSVAF